MENWKIIADTNGKYEVSDLGNVCRVEHTEKVISKTGKIIDVHYDRKPVKQYMNASGYNIVYLQVSHGIRLIRLVHRLVANAFISNPNNLRYVNHIDENKTNNSSRNLEWCSAQYNSNYGTRNERIKTKLSVPVAQFTKDGKLIKIWNSISDAAKYFNASTTIYISRVCNKEKGRISYKGFIWRYVNKPVIDKYLTFPNELKLLFNIFNSLSDSNKNLFINEINKRQLDNYGNTI